MKAFRPLSDDIAHYNMCDEDHNDHLYQFHYDAVKRHIQRAWQQRMWKSVSMDIQGAADSAAPGAVPPDLPA